MKESSQMETKPAFKKPQTHGLLTGGISFLLGALLLSIFSALQKILMHEAGLILQVRSYLVPVIYGGLTGLVLGQWYARLKRNELELLAAYDSTLKGWAKAIEVRDKNTQDHTDRVVLVMEALARAMKVPEDDLGYMKWGALLHDIGKIGVPDAILNKPGPLTDEEMVIMRQHPVKAMEMLTSIKFLHQAIEIPCCHHERWDGSGYPHGFSGEKIPLSARIFATIDVWDALVSDRPYRKAWPMADAVEYIQDNSGKQFDPAVVAAFMANIQEVKKHYLGT